MKNVWLPDANVLLCYLLRDIPDKVAVTEDFSKGALWQPTGHPA